MTRRPPQPDTTNDSISLVPLVMAAGAGDREAFGRLVERLHEPLASLAWMLTHHRADADDLLQETWVRAWSRLGGIEDPQAALGWLYRVMCTTATNLRQREARRRVRERSSRPVGDETRGEADPDLVSALDQLDATDRAMLLLTITHGHSYQLIGEMFEMTADAARQRMRRAREKLREALG